MTDIDINQLFRRKVGRSFITTTLCLFYVSISKPRHSSHRKTMKLLIYGRLFFVVFDDVFIFSFILISIYLFVVVAFVFSSNCSYSLLLFSSLVVCIHWFFLVFIVFFPFFLLFFLQYYLVALLFISFCPLDDDIQQITVITALYISK